jgi:adenylyl-sulfate kinase
VTRIARKKKASEGFTLWFTGLPCAGKTTLARLVADELERRELPVKVLDGDVVRKELSKGLGFDKQSRDENIRRIGFVCRVSPYRAVRDELRATVPNFIEVYVKAFLQTCISRDVKGLYKKALAGEIRNFTGVNDPYEPPIFPEIIIETDHEAPAVSASRILAKLEELRLICHPEEPECVPEEAELPGGEAVSDSRFGLTASGEDPGLPRKGKCLWTA